MLVTVQKTPDRPIIVAVRGDGVSLGVRAPDRKFSPPHDLVHFIVEQGLHLQRGFWGSVADGAKFDSMEVIEGRQKPHANERSAQVIAANRSHLAEAEAIVGAFQRVLHGDLRPHGEALRQQLQIAGRTVAGDRLQPTWQELVSFGERWAALPLSEVIRLEWSAAAERGRR
jgi:hypothetical protein